MISIAKDYSMIVNIKDLRDELGQRVIPMVRIWDNFSLLPKQLRLRYYADYLLDEEFTDASKAVNKILDILRKMAEGQLSPET